MRRTQTQLLFVHLKFRCSKKESQGRGRGAHVKQRECSKGGKQPSSLLLEHFQKEGLEDRMIFAHIAEEGNAFSDMRSTVGVALFLSKFNHRRHVIGSDDEVGIGASCVSEELAEV